MPRSGARCAHLRTTPASPGTAGPDDCALLAAPGSSGGVVCVVGAGGKKSTMRALARAWPGRVALTATAHMLPFPPDVADEMLFGTEAALLASAPATSGRVVVFAREHGSHGRAAGVSGTLPGRLAQAGFGLCLVKADGARGRLIKAPAHYEPVIAPGTGAVLALVSARAIGQHLDERVAHRCERITALTGLLPGMRIAPTHVAQLLAHADGLLRGCGAARAVPIINMADDAALARLAREAAQEALERSKRFDAVVLACMNNGAVVDVVRRRAIARGDAVPRARAAQAEAAGPVIINARRAPT